MSLIVALFVKVSVHFSRNENRLFRSNRPEANWAEWRLNTSGVSYWIASARRRWQISCSCLRVPEPRCDLEILRTQSSALPTGPRRPVCFESVLRVIRASMWRPQWFFIYEHLVSSSSARPRQRKGGFRALCPVRSTLLFWGKRWGCWAARVCSYIKILSLRQCQRSGTTRGIFRTRRGDALFWTISPTSIAELSSYPAQQRESLSIICWLVFQNIDCHSTPPINGITETTLLSSLMFMSASVQLKCCSRTYILPPTEMARSSTFFALETIAAKLLKVSCLELTTLWTFPSRAVR